MSIGISIYQLAYEISPITLQGGLASQLGTGLLPILALTEGPSYFQQILGGSAKLDPANFFAHFEPLPGSTLASVDVAKYAFANQNVAGNAVIFSPLNVSLKMTCPVKGDGGYAARLATMTILQQSLAKHMQLGGMYAVATPAYLYTNCILRSLRDITPVDKQPKQIVYQWDFEQPLLTQTAANQVFSSFINKLSLGVIPS